MNNLVIGNTSQLSQYFPNDYIKVSSHNIDYEFITSQSWDRVFICFGESRKFIQNSSLYDDINYHLTIKLVDTLKEISKTVIVYSTCELWNRNDGKINLDMKYNYYNSLYIDSKYKLSKHIMGDDSYDNVFVMFPFNFNSKYRNENFLFGKIYKSIINKEKIEIGDTYFYRDITHAKFVVEESINTNSHKIIGSGRMIYVNDFIKDLYSHYNLDYNELVFENKKKYLEYEKRSEYYLESENCKYTYQNLFNDTIQEIDELILNV